MSSPAADREIDPDFAAARGEHVQALQSRIRQMQATTLDSRLIPTNPAIARLLPGGGLKQGAAYSVERSAMLIMALLAAPSAAGSWCAVIGVPEFGVEAAQRFGIDLERLVLVPQPGEQWLAVTAAIADVMGVVVTRPPKRASDSSVSRLTARLRQRGTTLLVLGSWPHSEAMLSLSQSAWHGIGSGHGHLTAREVTVTVTSRAAGRPRSARLWLPAVDESVGAVGGFDTPLRGRPSAAGSALASQNRQAIPLAQARSAAGSALASQNRQAIPLAQARYSTSDTQRNGPELRVAVRA